MSWEQQNTGAVAHIQLAGEKHPRVMRMSVPGRHMALNALGALLAAMEVGAPAEAVLDGLAGFEGAPSLRAWSAPRTACGCSTTMRTTRRRSVPPWAPCGR